MKREAYKDILYNRPLILYSVSSTMIVCTSVGRAASSVFANSVLINNPISALMIGVLVTVLVQSSSTSTSIVVSMVGSGCE